MRRTGSLKVTLKTLQKGTPKGSGAAFPGLTGLLFAGLLVGGGVPSVQAQVLDWQGEAVQGGLLAGTLPDGFTAHLGDRALAVDQDRRFILGFTRDEPDQVTLTLRGPDGDVTETVFQVRQRDYDIQRIDGLKSEYVSPPADVLARIRADNAAIGKARAVEGTTSFWREGFVVPADGVISGIYGSQRILNGEPRQPHYGIDYAAPEGAPVRAPASGIILLVMDMYFSGNTVLLDHGFGLQSVFLHMSKVYVAPGDRVGQGELIGEIGATGRVTGPHLDWRTNWFDRRIDPQLLLDHFPPDPAAIVASD